MREILFRGRKDNGEWVEGYYVCVGEHHYILTGKLDLTTGYPVYIQYEVIPETVGQYTGLTDKNGRKIFEGDIVKMHFEGTSREYDGDFSEHCYDVDFDGYKIGVVTFGGYGTFLKISHGELYEDGEKVEDWKPARRSRLAAYRSEVIGNIHDNPELMGGNENENGRREGK